MHSDPHVTRPSRPSLFGPPAASPLIIAHRGGSLEAPENTLHALATVTARGATWAEVDVGLSRDGVPIVIHDDTFERTCGVPLALADAYAAELVALSALQPRFAAETTLAMAKAGILDLPRFVAEDMVHSLHPPTLSEALLCTEANVMVELKASSSPEALCQAVAETIDATGAASRVAVASFDERLLAAAEHHLPATPRIGVAEGLAEVRLMLQRDISALAVACDIAADIWASVPPHIALWVWTVYSGEQAARLAQIPVDGIITDAPRAVALRLRGGC